MKTAIVSTALALFAAGAQSAPTTAQALETRQFEAGITFIGVDASDTFVQSFPTNGQLQSIYNAKSISKISSAGGAVCSFFGVDGSDTFVVGEQEVDVGPPQVQVSGVCDSL